MSIINILLLEESSNFRYGSVNHFSLCCQLLAVTERNEMLAVQRILLGFIPFRLKIQKRTRHHAPSFLARYTSTLKSSSPGIPYPVKANFIRDPVLSVLYCVRASIALMHTDDRHTLERQNISSCI